MDPESIAAVLRAHAAEIRRRGVTRLDLFGSTARGDADESSDVDIIVDIAAGRKFSLVDLAGLRAYLQDLLGRETDVVVREDLRPAFRKAVDREATRLL